MKINVLGFKRLIARSLSGFEFSGEPDYVLRVELGDEPNQHKTEFAHVHCDLCCCTFAHLSVSLVMFFKFLPPL